MSAPPRSEVLRLLATPRWLALTLLLVALSVLFAVASTWQYQRAIDQVNTERAAASVPQPIETLVPAGPDVPAESLGRVGVVSGSYVADAWVTGRLSPSGEPGVWLMSAVDDGSGLLTPVLRGWLPTRSEPGEDRPRSGPVTVTGRVSSAENFYTEVAAGGPDELVAITDERLAEVWQQPLRPGYLVLVEQEPGPTAGDPVAVASVFGSSTDVGFPWQNAGYAAQWVVFIGFAGFMYWRLFVDDLRRRRGSAAAQPRQVAGRR